MTTRECSKLDASLAAAASGSAPAARHLDTCPRCRPQARQIGALVSFLHANAEEIFAEPPAAISPQATPGRRGAVRAAALVMLVLFSGWGLFAFRPVQERGGVALRGVPVVSFGITSTRQVDGRWEVAFDPVSGATSYELSLVSLLTGERAVKEAEGSPISVPLDELHDLTRGAEVVWLLRAWNGVHLVAQSPPAALMPEGVD